MIMNSNLNLVLYPRLGTCSRRAIQRKTTRWGRPYQYRPRITLLDRLAYETGWSREDVRDRLMRERAILLRQST